MNTTHAAPAPAERLARVSVAAVSLTTILAAFTHAYDFGPAAYLAGAVVVGLLIASGLGFGRTGHRLALGVYALLNLWIIAGFGVVGGFWNHAVRDLACAVRGGPLPASAEPWFMSLEPGSAAFETAGILTFLASLVAAWSGLRFIRAGLRRTRAA